MNQWVLREVVTSEELASSDNNKRDGQKRPSGTHLDREFPMTPGQTLQLELTEKNILKLQEESVES